MYKIRFWGVEVRVTFLIFIYFIFVLAICVKCRTEHYRLRHVEDSERGRGDQQVVYLLSLVMLFKLGI